jgi:predicted aspartyl protease
VVVQALEPRYVAPTLRDRIGRIWAPVLINGKGPFRLVVDTGASRSAVIARVADAVSPPGAAKGTLRVHGFTGSAVVPALPVETMEVGDLLIQSTTLPVVADVFGGAEGILGSEGFVDKRLYIDFGRDRISIQRSHRERVRNGFTAVPIRLNSDGLLTTMIKIGSIHVRAIIDTGAQRTVGNNALRTALRKRRGINAVSEEVIGVTLDAQMGESMSTPPISLGSFKIDGAHITFGDMFLFEHWNLIHEPAVLVGMDVLGLVDVLVIDYKLRELQIRPRGAYGARKPPGA